MPYEIILNRLLYISKNGLIGLLYIKLYMFEV